MFFRGLFNRVASWKRPLRRVLGVGFEVSLAIAGWTAIVLGLHGMSFGELASSVVGALLFLLVSAGARLFAFPVSGLVRGLPPSTALSIDGAMVVASALSVGAPITAVGLGLILTVDRAVRAVVARRSGRGGETRVRSVELVRQSLYTGGVAGGLLLLVAAPFRMHAHGPVWMVPAFGLSFLVAHAAIQIVHARLFGQPLVPALRRAAVALLAETTLLPLAAVIVQIWNPHRPVIFVLLGATYLLVNFGFFRIARITEALRRRVRELHTLTRTAQAMAAEVETPRLVAALLREVHRALPSASLVELRLGRRTSETTPPTPPAPIERFALERGRIRVRTSTVPRNEWDDTSALSIQEQLEGPIGSPRARAIAPLKIYGEPVGVLVVESRQSAPFGEHEARLLEAVAGQAASALENTRLQALANIDGLTGLYCRRYFDTRLVEEIERARRFDTAFCVVMLDIDNFKRLNDSRGHLAGDRALREVARLAQGQLRNVDLAARYGGEELVFVLPRTTLTDAHVVAERIRDAVGSHVFADVGRITVSIGVASFSDTGSEVPQLAANILGRADIALYSAKALGKDRVEVDLGPIELTPSLAPVTRRRRA